MVHCVVRWPAKVRWKRSYFSCVHVSVTTDTGIQIGSYLLMLWEKQRKDWRLEHTLSIWLHQLHWLSVWWRIEYIEYKVCHQVTPTSLAELCTPVSASVNWSHLHSATCGDLTVPHSRWTRCGQRILTVSGAWPIADIDLVLCTLEDCAILRNLQNTTTAASWQFRPMHDANSVTSLCVMCCVYTGARGSWGTGWVGAQGCGVSCQGGGGKTAWGGAETHSVRDGRETAGTAGGFEYSTAASCPRGRGQWRCTFSQYDPLCCLSSQWTTISRPSVFFLDYKYFVQKLWDGSLCRS